MSVSIDNRILRISSSQFRMEKRIYDWASNSNSLTVDDIKSIKDGAQKVLKDNILDNIVKINYLSDSDLILNREKALLMKPSKEKKLFLKNNHFGGTFGRGSKNISIKGKSSLLVVFHEIGHAINHLSSKNNFSTFAQKYINNKYFKPLPYIVASCALLLPSKTKSEPKTNKKNKIIKFVKNNVAILTFIPSIPILAKEVCASITGCKEAKKVLSPELYKNSVKMCKFGFATYMLNALGISAGAYAACKIKDKYVQKHSRKNI